MERDLRTQIMEILGVELSASFASLHSRLGGIDADLQTALRELVQGGLLLRSEDPVKGQVYYAPTGKGILQARREMRRSSF